MTENKDLIKYENKELLKYEKSLISNSIALCNDDHIEICYCQNNFLENKKQELMYKEYEELRKTGEIEDQSVVNRRLSLAKKKAFNAVANYCVVNNIKCPIEHQVVKDIIDRFKNIEAYDLKDPKVYLIVKSVINQQLSAHRMQLFSSSKGIVQSVYDTNGNHRYILSPVEEAKRKADDSIIKAVEKLSIG